MQKAKNTPKAQKETTKQTRKYAKCTKYPKLNLNQHSPVNVSIALAHMCAYDCVHLWYTIQH